MQNYEHGKERQTHACLFLHEIATWHLKHLASRHLKHLGSSQRPQIIAGVPSLQRGYVWDAGQVELLWDSIMRGFPIGSLVICKKLDTQKTRGAAKEDAWPDSEVNYHLLDGQQRCTSIALAFVDPCSRDSLSSEPIATLWLDLNPEPAPPNSSRQFLFRMLTKAHPWGYRRDDAASILGVEGIRKALKKYESLPDKTSAGRPSLIDAWPVESKTPIPFAWLIEAVIYQTLEGMEIWKYVHAKCESLDREWAKETKELLSGHIGGRNIESLAHIEQGLMNVRHCSVVALEVPKSVYLSESDQEKREKQAAADANLRISNIEHLFQRLNSGGTELRGEELIFSMIKAYWPSIEDSFEAIEDRERYKFLPVAGSHLASLGARAALINIPAGTKEKSLPAPLSITQIRRISHSDKFLDQKASIEKFFGIHGEPGSEASYKKSDLHQNLRQIDEWLLYSETNKYGLPPVLRTSLARNAPDVFLLLLYFAQNVRIHGQTKEKIAGLGKPILGLATALHWFGDNRRKAVDSLYQARFFDGGALSEEMFHGCLRECKGAAGRWRGMLSLHTVDELRKLIPEPSHEGGSLEAWRFWDEIVVKASDQQDRRDNAWPFLDRLRRSRVLLLYAQRAYICSQFSEYDPSRIDTTWAKSNRPWDYDHILPSATLYAKKHRTYKKACDEWVNTIGNLRAWPLELNRHRQDELARESILSEHFMDSFIQGADECEAFSMAESEINDPIKACAFMRASRDRMIRIYGEWFSNLDIAKLM